MLKFETDFFLILQDIYIPYNEKKILTRKIFIFPGKLDKIQLAFGSSHPTEEKRFRKKRGELYSRRLIY